MSGFWKKADRASADGVCVGRADGRGKVGFGGWLDRALGGARFGGSVGWSAYELRALRAMRASVPVIDAAVGKLVRLCGGFSVKTGDEGLDRELMVWARGLSTGHGGAGVDGFLDAYLDSLFVCGRAAGEMLLGEGGGVRGVICLDPAELEPREGRDPLDFRLMRGGRELEPERVLFTALAPEPGAPYGVSLLRSLGGVSEKLMAVFDAVGASWERFGSPRYAVTVRDADALFGDEERLEKIAGQWSRVMTAAPGECCDFVASGDLDIRVIGADGQEMDATPAVRLLCEQIVAKLGIPPFLLGFSWSSTERMSAQQSDLLTSEIDAVRRTVTPALEKLFSTELRARGRGEAACGIEWANVSLQDEVELAKAALYRAQAQEVLERLGE